MNDLTHLWNVVLDHMKDVVSKPNYSMWFKDTAILKKEDGIVVIGVPNIFARDWLYDKFHKQILKHLRDTDDSIRGIDYAIVDNIKKRLERRAEQAAAQQHTQSLPLDELYVNKDDNLNPRYTFETFVVAPFNELAHAAAQAIVSRPGGSYNPLYVYGDTGRGKTHLIQAIGNKIKQIHPSKRVYYVTSERFSNDFITAVQNNKSQQFKEKYRQYDVIILDDVQFFTNKEKTQEELFHLFNHFYDNNKQIVFSSDKHPHYIQDLEERVKSRFNAGMIVDIHAPDVESRLSILKAKTRTMQINLIDEVLAEIARLVEGNIRELEGALNSIRMHLQLRGSVSPHEVKSIIKTITRPQTQKNVSIKDLVKIIAEFYDVTEQEIYDKSRKKEVVKPRQVVMYILREDYDVSYPSIGEKLGGRDHTTVIHSCEKVKEALHTNPQLMNEVERIRSMLQFT